MYRRFLFALTSGMHIGCVLVCKTSVVSSILTPDSFNLSAIQNKVPIFDSINHQAGSGLDF